LLVMKCNARFGMHIYMNSKVLLHNNDFCDIIVYVVTFLLMHMHHEIGGNEKYG